MADAGRDFRQLIDDGGQSLTLIVVGRLAFASGGEGGGVAGVLAVDSVAVGVGRVALDADVMDLRRAHLKTPLVISRSTPGKRGRSLHSDPARHDEDSNRHVLGD